MEKGKESRMTKAVWNIEESQKMVKEKEGVVETKRNTYRKVCKKETENILWNWSLELIADLGETSFRGMLRAAVSSDRLRAKLEVRRRFSKVNFLVSVTIESLRTEAGGGGW